MGPAEAGMRLAWQAGAALVLGVAAPGMAMAQCTVVGPDSVCAGSTIELCGQDGPHLWQWFGPSGAAIGETRCISVGEPGLYTLRWFDGDNGLWFTCQQSVRAGDCDAPPPPPPSGEECPRSAAWWWRQCASSGGSVSLSGASFAAAAVCADARSAAVDAKGGAAMCEVIARPGRTADIRTRALRQFAVLQLNLCAREQGLTDARGNRIGLDAASLTAGLPGVADGTRVSDWAALAEAELQSLASRSLRERAVRRAYQRLRMQARLINVGRSGATPCGASPMGSEPDDEPELAFAAEGEAPALAIERLSPNPSRGAVRISWSLSAASEVELSVVDIAGRTVRELVRGGRSAGAHELVWDGAGEDGRPLRAGAYFVRGRVGDERVQARLMLVR